MLITYYNKIEEEENKKENMECTKKPNRFSLGVLPFYRELQKIYINNHPQVTIVVQNLIFL